MSTLQVVFWALTIVITVVVTIRVNKRSIEKKMTAYLDFISPLFAHVNPEVREDLEIRYGGLEVTELTQFRCIITNEGQQAIGDYEKPLTLHLDGGNEIFSLEISAQNPDELEVDWDASESEDSDGQERLVRLRFPFLNSGDWFVLTGLVEGELSSSDLSFSIREKNLPAEVPLEPSFSYSPPGFRNTVIPAAGLIAGIGAAAWYLTIPVEEWLETTAGIPSPFSTGILVVGAILVLALAAGTTAGLISKIWPAKHVPPPFTSMTRPGEAWQYGRHGIAYRDSIPEPTAVFERGRWERTE